MSLAEAAAEAEALAARGAEQELATLRSQWAEELEHQIRSRDFRERAVAYRAVGQFRFRAKTELLRRGLEDESPACRGSALVALAQLSKDHPGLVNAVRPLLHELVTADPNGAVRRLAAVCLGNGSPQRETITLLEGLAERDEEDRELREAARRVGGALRKRANTR